MSHVNRIAKYFDRPPAERPPTLRPYEFAWVFYLQLDGRTRTFGVTFVRASYWERLAYTPEDGWEAVPVAGGRFVLAVRLDGVRGSGVSR